MEGATILADITNWEAGLSIEFKGRAFDAFSG